MPKTLVIAEKPSVGKDIASALPGLVHLQQGQDRTSSGTTHVITWAVGHLVGLAEPDSYDPRFKKWRFADLPIVPDEFTLVPNDEKSKKQLSAIHKLMKDDEIERGRERLRRRPRGRADLRLHLRRPRRPRSPSGGCGSTR